MISRDSRRLCYPEYVEKSGVRGLYVEIGVIGILLAGILYGLNANDAFGALLLRWICGSIFVLFVPGYALQSALFPQAEVLDLPERLALSIGLSVALAPLFAWVLDKLTITRIELWPILVMEGGFALVCLIVAQVRRTPVQSCVAPFAVSEDGLGGLIKQFSAWWTTQAWGDRLLLLFLAGALTVAGIAAAHMSCRDNPLWLPKAETLTEFYILGAEGLGEDYPRTIYAANSSAVINPQAQGCHQPLTVTVGIHRPFGSEGMEQEPANYRVLVVQGADDISVATLITQTETFQLAPGERREIPFTFYPSHFTLSTSHIEMQFLLYWEGVDGPYRTLRLWLNVVE